MRNLWCGFSILFIFLIPSGLCADENPYSGTISVSGDAEVRVVPDEVVLTFGVETWNKELQVAKKENDDRIRMIIEAVKKSNVEEKLIQTDFLSIEPRYEDHYEHKNFIGYFVRKTTVVTLRDISKFEKVLSDVLESGANYVHGINFRTTELRKYRDQARSLATKAAKEKAVALAEELGQKVGRPLNINESRSGWWSGYNSWWGQRWSGGMAQNVIQNVPASGGMESDSATALGQIKVNATVSVTFELK